MEIKGDGFFNFIKNYRINYTTFQWVEKISTFIQIVTVLSNLLFN